MFAPDSRRDRVDRIKAWMARRGRTVAVIGAAVIGVWLVVSAVIASCKELAASGTGTVQRVDRRRSTSGGCRALLADASGASHRRNGQLGKDSIKSLGNMGMGRPLAVPTDSPI